MSVRKHIPNTLTCCNLICGCIAVYFASLPEYEWALLFIIGGAVFDFFDGMSARLLGVSSPIGKELDSLADVVTFGVAPSFMLFSFLQYTDCFPGFAAFVMAAFSALRLAKFNLDERQTTSFIGLPTPANALFWGSLLQPESPFWSLPVKEQGGLVVFGVLLLAAVSCYLLVSEIPMFALKFKQWGWKGNEIKYLFAGISLILIVCFGLFAFCPIIALYVIVSCVQAYLSRRRQSLS